MNKLEYIPVSEIRPYKNNPRKNAGAVEAVAASIRKFGFKNPIIIDKDGTIVNGHTRFKAAKKLGLKEVPCIRAEDLTEEQIREFRLIDNKTSELASWDADMLAEELKGLELDLEYEFDFTDDLKKRKKWEKNKVACDLKDSLGLKRCNDTLYHSIFKAGKKGVPLEDIKCEENVRFFADTAVEVILSILGPNIKDAKDWCLMTTPRRRHKEGFHFATDVCFEMTNRLIIPFYNDQVISENNVRENPIFNLRFDPPEKNVIIYDDVLTTGYTLRATKELLTDKGHIVFPVISIDNH